MSLLDKLMSLEKKEENKNTVNEVKEEPPKEEIKANTKQIEKKEPKKQKKEEPGSEQVMTEI